jgi:hypothetical protein
MKNELTHNNVRENVSEKRTVASLSSTETLLTLEKRNNRVQKYA